MEYKSMIQRACRWLLAAALFSFGFAMAQSEPTLNEVYAVAQAGKLDQAQVMMQQVLISHPNSAKAHFVQSELYARQGNLPRAREALAAAEKFAPGLPFAKPEAVQALRAQLLPRSGPVTPNGAAGHDAVAGKNQPSSFSWGLPLLLAGGVIVLGYFMFRGRRPAPYAPQPVYGTPGGLSGPQSFGMGGGGAMQPTYGQPAGTGLGGAIMGGVATGLAVGAGVMAAEAIGRNIMGHHDPSSPQSDGFANHDDQPLAGNSEMGGQNFGVNDASSWDDAGAVDVGGGGDWDN